MKLGVTLTAAWALSLVAIAMLGGGACGDASTGTLADTPPPGDVFFGGFSVGGSCSGDVYVDGTVGYLVCEDGKWVHTMSIPSGCDCPFSGDDTGGDDATGDDAAEDGGSDDATDDGAADDGGSDDANDDGATDGSGSDDATDDGATDDAADDAATGDDAPGDDAPGDDASDRSSHAGVDAD